MGHNTKVNFKIRNNYEVSARFNSQGTEYDFNMKHWKRTGEVEVDFNYFAGLLTGKFPSGALETEFGATTVVTSPEGVQTITITRSAEQALNILKYAVVEVFRCAEEIICQNRRSVVDYAIMHREQGKQSTYEEYIHLVACHCLVHSNFHAPNVVFPPVDFCTVEQDYMPGALGCIHQLEEDTD
ncbi:hypothetical protein TSOC_007257 [Tetrabaena socialis]|uniref:Uncharacterized protein n=1 Tax=Tetrabaena socialis TaxID=47790 RepID=A0A2J8A1H7_9CHLO|nr:hypothetical protein TSOC_007257 [Tetrabaena socialis]|eukprot:PNH06379.1 hypothetical protein TSOC_007257 [Tetrabaena socialis]